MTGYKLLEDAIKKEVEYRHLKFKDVESLAECVKLWVKTYTLGVDAGYVLDCLLADYYITDESSLNPLFMENFGLEGLYNRVTGSLLTSKICTYIKNNYKSLVDDYMESVKTITSDVEKVKLKEKLVNDIYNKEELDWDDGLADALSLAVENL